MLVDIAAILFIIIIGFFILNFIANFIFETLGSVALITSGISKLATNIIKKKHAVGEQPKQKAQTNISYHATEGYKVEPDEPRKKWITIVVFLFMCAPFCYIAYLHFTY